MRCSIETMRCSIDTTRCSIDTAPCQAVASEKINVWLAASLLQRRHCTYKKKLSRPMDRLMLCWIGRYVILTAVVFFLLMLLADHGCSTTCAHLRRFEREKTAQELRRLNEMSRSTGAQSLSLSAMRSGRTTPAQTPVKWVRRSYGGRFLFQCYLPFLSHLRCLHTLLCCLLYV